MQSTSEFLDITKITDYGKMLISADIKGCVTRLYIFEFSFGMI